MYKYFAFVLFTVAVELDKVVQIKMANDEGKENTGSSETQDRQEPPQEQAQAAVYSPPPTKISGYLVLLHHIMHHIVHNKFFVSLKENMCKQLLKFACLVREPTCI